MSLLVRVNGFGLCFALRQMNDERLTMKIKVENEDENEDENRHPAHCSLLIAHSS
jgi:hypothetical protein